MEMGTGRTRNPIRSDVGGKDYARVGATAASNVGSSVRREAEGRNSRSTDSGRLQGRTEMASLRSDVQAGHPLAEDAYSRGPNQATRSFPQRTTRRVSPRRMDNLPRRSVVYRGR